MNDVEGFGGLCWNNVNRRASNGLHMGPIPHNTPVTAITTAAANVNQRTELAGNRN